MRQSPEKTPDEKIEPKYNKLNVMDIISRMKDEESGEES
jgi:hypothetical protein